MKAVPYIFLFFLIYSCSLNHSRDHVRKKAIQHESYTELNGVIEYYSICYYHLPETPKDLCDFLMSWKQSDPEGYSYDQINSRLDIISSLQTKKPTVAFYSDSLFWYFKKDRLGCCVFGHPYYWLKHQDEFPKDRTDYYAFFKPAAFDIDGEYIFNFDYVHFINDIVMPYLSNHKKAFINFSGIIIVEYENNGESFEMTSAHTLDDSYKLSQEITDSFCAMANVVLRDVHGIHRIIIPLFL